MHSLDIIVKRNAEAAGREAGHAYTDQDFALANRILSASLEESRRIEALPARGIDPRDAAALATIECDAYLAGDDQGRQEG